MPAQTLYNRHDADPRFYTTRRISSVYDQVWSFDTEGFLIAAARLVPPMVCMTYDPVILRGGSGILHAKFDRQTLYHIAYRALTSNTLIIGLNVAFDLAMLANEFPDLLPLIFKAYMDDRVIEVANAQQLIDIANGCFRGKYAIGPDGIAAVWIKYGYGLADLVRRHFGIDLDKDTHRFEYGKLIDTPCDLWTPGQRDYATGDARYARAIWDRLDTPENQAALIDVFRQSRAAWWLQLMMAWGIAVDPVHIAELKKKITADRDLARTELRRAGLLKYNDKKDTKAAMARMELACAAKGIPVKRTKEGVSLDEEACVESGDPVMKHYARFTSLNGILNKDIAALEPAALAGLPIQSRFDSLVETGRVSCSGGAEKKGGKKKAKGLPRVHSYQLHNVRREPGVRESFVGRSGTYLLSVDYGMFELCTWAQVCMKICGFSELGKALNARRDVHIDLGAQILGIAYEEAFARKLDKEIKDVRQLSKIPNFALPGGMGWKALQAQAKQEPYHIILPDEKAQMLVSVWRARWTENKEYFKFINSLVGRSDSGVVKHFFSGRLRAGVPYTVACNSFFQGLAADCMKDAGMRISYECYVEEAGSVLFGCRIVNSIHDEFILEVPIERADACARRVTELMEDAGRLWCPDVPPHAEPALMLRWSKAAEPVWCDNRLIPWRPELAAIRKAHAANDRGKVVSIWSKLNAEEQRAMMQVGVAA